MIVTDFPTVENTEAATARQADLFSAAEWAGDTYAIHWDRCRSRMAGRDCVKCDQLDDASAAAERAYLEASGG